MYLIGYIKLWRKSLVSQVFASETLWHIWCWCLLKTNRFKKETFFRTGKSGITITVQPGQFIFGRHTAADELNKPGSTVWYNIQKLQKLGMIKIETNKQYSIISIVNWKDYQGEVDKQLTSNGQATDKQLTQHKNGKKGKNDNKEPEVIFNLWNEQKIVVHKDFNKYKPDISGRLKLYEPEIIKEAIKNFGKVFHSKETRWTYKWTLDEFLQRKTGLDKFTPDNFDFNNYKIFDKSDGKSEVSRRY